MTWEEEEEEEELGGEGEVMVHLVAAVDRVLDLDMIWVVCRVDSKLVKLLKRIVTIKSKRFFLT